MTDTDESATDRVCQRCSAGDKPLRSIKMLEGDRELLCEGCFNTALYDQEVDPTDPRTGPGYSPGVIR